MDDRGDGWSRNGWRIDAIRKHGSRLEDCVWIEVAVNQGTARGFLVEYYPEMEGENDLDNEVRLIPGNGSTIEHGSEEAKQAKLLAVIVGKLSGY